MVALTAAAVEPGGQQFDANGDGQSIIADADRHVTHIDFRRGKDDAGRVVLKLSGVHAPVSVRRAGARVLAVISDTQLPVRWQKHLDVRDFGSIVDSIDVDRNNGDVQVKIKPRKGADFTQIAYATGHTVNIEIRPRGNSQSGGKKKNKSEYTGQKISLSFQDVEVRKLLQIIADVAKVNLVTSGQVSGAMSLRLQDVPWDQALHIILRSQGLGKRRDGNVINIAPLAQMAARDKAERAANRATENLKPIHNQIIALNYAQAGDIKKLVKAGKGGAGSLLSERGHIQVDQRTNSLIIGATQPHIDAIQKLIKQLDHAQQQVLIQARIVLANRDFGRKLGTQFNARGAEQKAGTGPGGNQIAGARSRASQVNAGGFSTSLPVGNATSELATSIITGHMNIGLVLQAMQTEKQGKIVSSPRVITANGQKASVSRGTQIPYLSSTGRSNVGTSIDFKKAELKLAVTPRITPDDHILMDLNIQQDSRGETIPTANGGSEPAINTNQLKTKVLVDNGNTLVLGGIYKHINTQGTSSVPFFGKIPLLGRLFKKTTRTNNRRQLLIFITPRILDSQVRQTASN
ncbi:type IV pilus secretin PilQ [Salinisphaera orenii]|uniref:type IV pilus secretin PilQ n=1 Tax=Salinisphaera orenii TaxID=856731 RepID=UPI000DBE4CB3